MKRWKAPAAALLVIVAEHRTALALRAPLKELDVSGALSCLRLTTPNLQLVYPHDAERHVDDIYNAMLPFRPNFTKRWSYHIEDIWMTDVWAQWKNRSNGTLLTDLFGPYIPLFTYWVAPWVGKEVNFNRMRYPKGMLTALRHVLRKRVPYVTVSQSDTGLFGWHELPYSIFPNLLVLSAGGYGHAAVPLHLTDAGTYFHAHRRSKDLLSHQYRRRPVRERKYFVNFVGNVNSSHGPVRQPMVAALQDFVSKHGNSTDLVAIYRGSEWQEVMRNSRFSLVPRGVGRTSYHLVETIQLGLIPIHVYEDIPWVPFPKVYEKFGFQTDVKGLPQLLERLLQMPHDDIDALEEQVVKYAHSHFTPEGELTQITRFLTGKEGGGDILCQQLPNSSGATQ